MDTDWTHRLLADSSIAGGTAAVTDPLRPVTRDGLDGPDVPVDGMDRADILIVGGGPAGLAAARTCEGLGVNYQIIEAAPEVGGQLLWTHTAIDDYLGLSGTSATALLDHLKDGLKPDWLRLGWRVTGADPERRRVFVTTSAGERRSVSYQRLILAIGARPRPLPVPGLDLPGVHDASFSLSRHAIEFAGRTVVIVGGGDRALEGALTLARAGARVHVLQRSARLRARPLFADAAMANRSVQVALDTVVTAIRCEVGAAGGLIVEAFHQPTGQEVQIPCDAVVVRIGMDPPSEWLRGWLDVEPDGTLPVDGWGRTRHLAVYACGDAVVPAFGRRLQTAIGQGMLAARTAVMVR
ncbi:MAG: NAD(P)/FAD-dependent oxidoreductase [Alicyclobacillus sp.]|nr:NAD(P)/FAD-dependent oxidoreductase [Alicyclobacillus sp.]